ncbi:MAG TPA: sulfotransferase [Actinomycetota bacterium]
MTAPNHSGAGPVKVLYLMGHGGSGTTILGNVLGELDGFVHVGELDTLWAQGLAGRQVCGCGLAFDRCPVWAPAIASALRLPDGTELDRSTVDRWHRRAVRVRYAIRLLGHRPGRTAGRPELDGYVGVLSRLYAGLAAVTGAHVIVDSSKRSGDAAALRLAPGVDAYVVHVVRDPRAVAWSWARRDDVPPLTTMREWIGFNAIDDAVRIRYGPRRAALVRYEDFMRRPVETVERLARLAGSPANGMPFVDARTVRLRPNHTAAGHWSRFGAGPVRLEPDREWASKQSAHDRRLVTAVALPQLLRYRYPLSVSGRPPTNADTASAKPRPQGRSSR